MTPDWPWPESLDALAAAPAQHRVLFENAHVRVLDTRINPGQRTPVHTHRWPAAHYIVSWSDFVRRDADGTVLLDTRKTDHARVGTPEALWGDALPPHSLENVGTVPLHIISTEVKSAATHRQAADREVSGSKKDGPGRLRIAERPARP